MTTQTYQAAFAAGYQTEVLADCGLHSLTLLVKSDQDYDDAFGAFDVDAQEYVKVNGWLWTFETL